MKSIKGECPDLRSAFCARYRCSPENFERKAFRKGLPFHATMLCSLLGGRNHARFQNDLEILRTIGEASDLDQLNRALDEMWSLNEMNRDWFRKLLRLRLSTERIQSVFGPLLSQVTQPAAPVEVRRTVSEIVVQARGADEARYRPAEVAAQRLRRVLRIHSAITMGRDLDDVLSEERITRRELDDLLQEFGRLRAEVGWLQTYFREQEELDGLRGQFQRGQVMTVA